MKFALISQALCACALWIARGEAEAESDLRPVMTMTTITTKVILRRQGSQGYVTAQFPGNGAGASALLASRGSAVGSAYLSTAAALGQADKINTFRLSAVPTTTFIAYPNDATAYCFALPTPKTTQIPRWVGDAQAINSVATAAFVSNIQAYVAESSRLFSSACGVGSTTSSSSSSSSSSSRSSSSSISTTSSSTTSSTPTITSSTPTSTSSRTTTTQNSQDSLVSVIQSLVPTSALDDPRGLCFLYGFSTTPAWYVPLPTDAKSFLSSFEATNTGNCATTSATTASLITSTPATTSDGSTVRPNFFGQSLPTATSSSSISPTPGPTAPAAAKPGLSAGTKGAIGGGVAGGVIAIGAIIALAVKLTGGAGAAATSSSAAAASSQAATGGGGGGGGYGAAASANPGDGGISSAANGASSVGNPANLPPHPPPMHHQAGVPFFAAAGIRDNRNSHPQNNGQMYAPVPAQHTGSTSPTGYSSPSRGPSFIGDGQWSPDGSNQGLVRPGSYDSRNSYNNQYPMPAGFQYPQRSGDSYPEMPTGGVVGHEMPGGAIPQEVGPGTPQPRYEMTSAGQVRRVQ